ncbi:MAG: hypothetical protein CR996_01180 [Draconibacterium sp.]|nr:MAG: hypothetical protein CR996_01180 [Draconibacterium sp.]PIF06580.1 MAG: hypothetical protein CSA36_01065 [Draconibacterium sp.]
MKIAAAYINSVPGNVSANLQETLKMLSYFEKEQVRFALFPELNLSGYITSKEEIKKLLKLKTELFGQLQQFSKNTQIVFAVGFPEEENGRFYITHFIFEKGEITGKHRKTHLSPTEKIIFSEENRIKAFKAGKLIIGMQLCFETHFPEISYAQAKQGANLLAMAFASPKENGKEKLERFKRHLCARAYDNACYVLACNLAGTTSRGTTLPGLAMIIDPKGKVLAEETKAANGYCIADFKTEMPERIHQSKMAWFNNFKRNEILRQFYE